MNVSSSKKAGSARKLEGERTDSREWMHGDWRRRARKLNGGCITDFGTLPAGGWLYWAVVLASVVVAVPALVVEAGELVSVEVGVVDEAAVELFEAGGACTTTVRDAVPVRPVWSVTT